jgi:spore coat polysaccharide biosynthesis predicted glycosyltransferase SpsG
MSVAKKIIEQHSKETQKFPDRMSLTELAWQLINEGKAHSKHISAVVNELFKAKNYAKVDFSSATVVGNCTYYPLHPEISTIRDTYLKKEYTKVQEDEDEVSLT